MRPEDMLDVLYEIREYLEREYDVIGDAGDVPNTPMRLGTELSEVIRSLGGE